MTVLDYTEVAYIQYNLPIKDLDANWAYLLLTLIIPYKILVEK